MAIRLPARSSSLHRGGPEVTPSLAVLLKDPSRVQDLPSENVPVLLTQCAGEQTKLGALLIALAARSVNLLMDSGEKQAPKTEDRWLTVEEAGKIAGLNPRWFYRQESLPFARKISRKITRYSEAGLRRWLSTRRTS